MRNLKQLLGICEHKWETISTRELLNENDKIIGFFCVLKCKNCGYLKKKKLEV